ncbi:unnamed protein product [Arabidopsis thaliana]|uniref:Uncharacterized protein n=1 Tax=Arabidopsis thaliana TaxID=3702 RepID=A0A5S9XZU7_ARATH|nr:unnamed protein product [Arabidopsis thaliana]
MASSVACVPEREVGALSLAGACKPEPEVGALSLAGACKPEPEVGALSSAAVEAQPLVVACKLGQAVDRKPEPEGESLSLAAARGHGFLRNGGSSKGGGKGKG